jgi:indole-3-glycerol phosphate synthase
MPTQDDKRQNLTRRDTDVSPEQLKRHHKAATWKTVLIAALAALPPTIASIAALKQSTTNHGVMNSRVDQLIAEAASAAAAKAVAAERLQVELARKGMIVLPRSEVKTLPPPRRRTD